MASTDKSRERGFSIRERLWSFLNSFSGIRLLLKFEHNFRIHLAILLAVIIAGLILRLSSAEWLVIIISSAMVLASESFNSAIEYLSDAVSGEFNPEIKKAKDVAAAAVLISVIGAIVAGLIIFIPEILSLFMKMRNE